VITGLKKATNGAMCSAKNKPGKDLNVQSTMWGCVLMQIRFNWPNCNVGLCFDPARVFHTKSQFWNHYTTVKYHFSLRNRYFL